MTDKRKGKTLIIIIVLVSLIICSHIIVNIVTILRYRSGHPDEIIYMNNIESNIDYKVYLKPNEFIDSPYITNDFSFISQLVEYIKTSFTYNYVGSEYVSVDYDYYITATIVSKYASNSTENISKAIWNKESILLDHKKGSSPNSVINITEDLNIGMDYYNNLVESFRKTLNLSLDSELNVTFIVSIKGTLENKMSINKQHYMTMSVPLDVAAFDIDIFKNFSDQEVTYSKEQKTIASSYMIAIIYIVLELVIVAGAIYFINRIIDKGKSEYDSKLGKILDEYDDRIVTVSNFIKYKKYEIVSIPTFEELLTLSDETLEPIIYWEKKNFSNKEAWFSIVRNKILYCYILIDNK